ncbi:MAG: hypothetical protein JSU86_13025 [Phycisphaerales bacterium]|nr:MAG: hypothetical protein JSU86_13025 [Phycisphaerales bacterium]
MRCKLIQAALIGLLSRGQGLAGVLLAGTVAFAHGQSSSAFAPQAALDRGSSSSHPVIPDGGIWTEPPVLLSPDAPVHRVVVRGGPGDGTVVSRVASRLETTCEGDPSAVYCNTLGSTTFGPPDNLAGAGIGDDIALASVGGCILDRYVIRVTGDKDRDGSGVALGAYTVNFGLYEMCPGAGADHPIEGTADQVTVPAEEAGIIKEIVFEPPGRVELPPSLYLGVSFSRERCGVVMGSPATLGYSADRFDFPGSPCSSTLGGFPEAPHASFYAEIYTEGDCPDAFVGYKNTNHAGDYYTPGIRVWFADDVRLGVAECNMVAYEIAHKGDGIIGVDLRSFLSDTDPSRGGLIPGTQLDCFSSGSDVQVCRKEFDTPIPLPESSFYVAYQANSSSVGPLVTCKQASVGSTEDLWAVYDGGQWRLADFGDTCYSGFEITITCEGPPPAGACCDMILTDHAGESVCRELPQMNCAFPQLWQEGALCESACLGGERDGQPCTRQADCPEGDCPGPFEHPCGLSACCTPDLDCFDLTENECHDLLPAPDLRIYQRGQYCGDECQRCPTDACLGRAGNCTAASQGLCIGGSQEGEPCDFGLPCRESLCCIGGGTCTGEPGCGDQICCTDVCAVDEFCCTVHWDEVCASLAESVCVCSYGSNDECFSPLPNRGAYLLNVPSVTQIDLTDATEDAEDPGFCCHLQEPGAQGVGTRWYKFVAPSPVGAAGEPPSVKLSLRNISGSSDRQAGDSLMAVFTASDPDRGLCSDLSVCSVSAQDCADESPCMLDEETACETLITTACNDDATASGATAQALQSGNSEVCVPALVPGHTYYVMVAAKTEVNRGYYTLTVTHHCSVTPSDTVPDCDADGLPDVCKLPPLGSSTDCNANSIPDECDVVVANNCCETGHGAGCSHPDIEECVCEYDPYCCDTEWIGSCVYLVNHYGCGDCTAPASNDCNANEVPDECDLADGTLHDADGNGIADECQPGKLASVKCCISEKDLIRIGLCLSGPGDTNIPSACGSIGTCVLGFAEQGLIIEEVCDPEDPEIPDEPRAVCISWAAREASIKQECVASPNTDFSLFETLDADQDGDLDLRDMAAFQRTYESVPKEVQSGARLVFVECCVPAAGMGVGQKRVSGADVAKDAVAAGSQPVCTLGFSGMIEPGDYLYELCRPGTTPKPPEGSTCVSWSAEDVPIAFLCEGAGVCEYRCPTGDDGSTDPEGCFADFAGLEGPSEALSPE